jgi:ubiquinone/menaquinone biosynthesis C-methylase UbiE
MLDDKNAAYKEWITRVFDRSSEQYSQIGPRFFQYFGQKVVERAGVMEGSTILDVACGRGANLVAAYDKAGPAGKVIGVDLSAQMVAETQKELASSGLDAIQVKQMDAEELQFLAGTFDFVLCGFALFFFPDVEKALSEILRVLKPGGVFCATTFGDDDKRWTAFDDMGATYKDRLKPVPLVKRKTFNEVEQIIETFTQVGFQTIEIFPEDKEFYFQDVDEWWASLWSHGMRGLLERMDEETLNEFKKDSYQCVQEIAGQQGIPQMFRVWITRARRVE